MGGAGGVGVGWSRGLLPCHPPGTPKSVRMINAGTEGKLNG